VSRFDSIWNEDLGHGAATKANQGDAGQQQGLNASPRHPVP